ncbi:MAG: prolipoprotein diacylglyceryl transferase [Thiotrichaceae bacterium]
MITHPNIDPVAIKLGPLAVHWYGIMYVIGFLAFLYLGKMRARRKGSLIAPEQVDDMMFYGALGVVLGGRLGYVLFYSFDKFLQDPIMLFKTTQGGMSFHGGLLGVLFISWLLARKYKLKFLEIGDFIAPMIPIGLGAGRIANFLNQELWGKPTDVAWGVVFPKSGDGIARHPSQIYEFLLEGVVLFLILWIYSKKPRPVGRISGLFLLFYGLFRAFVEFYRLPDAHVGYLAFGWLTEGQLLSLPMIIFGLILIALSYRHLPNSNTQGNKAA